MLRKPCGQCWEAQRAYLNYPCRLEPAVQGGGGYKNFRKQRGAPVQPAHQRQRGQGCVARATRGAILAGAAALVASAGAGAACTVGLTPSTRSEGAWEADCQGLRPAGPHCWLRPLCRRAADAEKVQGSSHRHIHIRPRHQALCPVGLHAAAASRGAAAGSCLAGRPRPPQAGGGQAAERCGCRAEQGMLACLSLPAPGTF